MSEIENKKTTEKNNAKKSWFFETINTIDKHLARLTKTKRKDANKIGNEREVVTSTTEIRRIVQGCHERIYVTKCNNLEEMDELLETCSLPGLNHEELRNLNRPINSEEIESIIQSPSPQ